MAKRKTGRPKNPMPTVQVSCVIPVDIQAEARSFAAKDGYTLAAWIRRQIYRGLSTETTQAA